MSPSLLHDLAKLFAAEAFDAEMSGDGGEAERLWAVAVALHLRAKKTGERDVGRKARAT